MLKSLRSHEAFGQLLRFMIAGGGVALVSVLAYWICAIPLAIPPMIANFISYAVNVTLGFNAHRIWSFKGFGHTVPVRAAALRYFLISLCALGMNSAWVWVLTTVLRQPAWTPIVPMVFVTPLATFALNRHWTFRANRSLRN